MSPGSSPPASPKAPPPGSQPRSAGPGQGRACRAGPVGHLGPDKPGLGARAHSCSEPVGRGFPEAPRRCGQPPAGTALRFLLRGGPLGGGRGNNTNRECPPPGPSLRLAWLPPPGSCRQGQPPAAPAPSLCGALGSRSGPHFRCLCPQEHTWVRGPSPGSDQGRVGMAVGPVGWGRGPALPADEITLLAGVLAPGVGHAPGGSSGGHVGAGAHLAAPHPAAPRLGVGSPGPIATLLSMDLWAFRHRQAFEASFRREAPACHCPLLQEAL